jgi:hypothetical protein
MTMVSGLGAWGSGQNNKNFENVLLTLTTIGSRYAAGVASGEPRAPSPESFS